MRQDEHVLLERLHAEMRQFGPVRTEQRTADRFWARVDRGGWSSPTRPELGQCWLFTGNATERIHYRGRRLYPGPFVWEISFGPIPFGLVRGHPTEVHRHCGRPDCVRPEHLFLASKRGAHGYCREPLLMPVPKRECGAPRHHKAKLSACEVRAIRAERRGGVTLQLLARRYRVSIGTIHDVVTGVTWRHVT